MQHPLLGTSISHTTSCAHTLGVIPCPPALRHTGDSTTARALTLFASSPTMNIDTCKTAAANAGHQYFALQGGTDCYIGGSYCYWPVALGMLLLGTALLAMLRNGSSSISRGP